MGPFDAARARALRLNACVGIEDLALLAGVSPNTVRHALEGKHQPWPRVAAAIAHALGVTTAELTPATGPLTLRDIRRRLGLAQKDIATRAGVCRQMVSRVERGIGSVSKPDKWADAYNLTRTQWLRAYQTTRKSALERAAARARGTTGGT